MRVSFGGDRQPARDLRFTATELRVIVPERASGGAITVRLPDGRFAATTAPFAPTPVPEGTGITVIDPTCQRPGCEVTIWGHGFARRRDRNEVFFGDTPVTVRRATGTELTVELPHATGAHPFRVNVRGLREAQSPPFAVGQ
jgi:hypothetical protein